VLLGRYSDRPGGGGQALPRVVVISITRTRDAVVARGGPVSFVVSIHEEGTALSWQNHVHVTAKAEAFLLDAVARLHRWSVDRRGSPRPPIALCERLGRMLYRTFIGREGTRALEGLHPTAVMVAADESIVGLPWELLTGPDGRWPFELPFGRIVGTGTVPAARRDPKDEDPLVRILAIADPTGDLPATLAEVDAVAQLSGTHGDIRVEVTTLPPAMATRAGFADAVAGQDYDILHFAGHGAFARDHPGQSALLLADGRFSANDVRNLTWSAPPFIVFNSACESARTAARRRLVSADGDTSGLPAAFLAAGAEAYLGHFWPVGDDVARTFATVFYGQLLARANVGTAVLEARQALRASFVDTGDLAAVGAVFFGDAGSAERRDLAQAV